MLRYWDKQTFKTEITKVFEIHRQNNTQLFGMIDRWDRYPEGEKIMNSLKHQSKVFMKKNKNPTAWRSCMHLDMMVLFSNIESWMWEMEFKPMRPKERKEAIDRIKLNAMRILEDLHALGLPINSAQYFTQDELFERYQQMFQMFDLPDELTGADYVDFRKDLKPYIELFWGDYPKSDLLVSHLLMKLADGALLDKLAEPVIVSKTESENFPRIFMIRKLAQWFAKKFGKELHNTIANLCVLIFDDTSIDRDTVRSALSGFQVDTQPDWRMKYPHILERLDFGRGKKPSK